MKIICIKPKIIKRSLNLNEIIRNICIFFFIRQIIYLHTENNEVGFLTYPYFSYCNSRTYLLAAILKNNHILKFFIESVALFYTFRNLCDIFIKDSWILKFYFSAANL